MQRTFFSLLNNSFPRQIQMKPSTFSLQTVTKPYYVLILLLKKNYVLNLHWILDSTQTDFHSEPLAPVNKWVTLWLCKSFSSQLKKLWCRKSKQIEALLVHDFQRIINCQYWFSTKCSVSGECDEFCQSIQALDAQSRIRFEQVCGHVRLL